MLAQLVMLTVLMPIFVACPPPHSYWGEGGELHGAMHGCIEVLFSAFAGFHPTRGQKEAAKYCVMGRCYALSSLARAWAWVWSVGWVRP